MQYLWHTNNCLLLTWNSNFTGRLGCIWQPSLEWMLLTQVTISCTRWESKDWLKLNSPVELLGGAFKNVNVRASPPKLQIYWIWERTGICDLKTSQVKLPSQVWEPLTRYSHRLFGACLGVSEIMEFLWIFFFFCTGLNLRALKHWALFIFCFETGFLQVV